MTNENKTIGLRIRFLREKQNLTREKLSEKAEISSQFLADIETGKKGMTVTTFMKICNSLCVSPNDLIFGFQENNLYIDEIVSLLQMADEKTQIAIKDIIQIILHLHK